MRIEGFMKIVICLCCIFVFAAGFVLFTNPIPDKLDTDIQNQIKIGAKEIEYLVIMKDQAIIPSLKSKTKSEKAHLVYHLLKNHASTSQNALRNLLETENADYHSYYVVNAIWVRSDIRLLMKIAERTDVSAINSNPWIRMQEPEVSKEVASLRSAEPEWGILKIKADSVWMQGFKGQGVVVGGQDTGYDWEVSPLKDKYRGFIDENADHNYNWHDAVHENNPRFADTLLNPCGYSIKVPCDDNNHGTHTMGTMVGEDEENKIGVAPEAKWIACRNMDRGWGKPSTYIECFEWFLAPYDLDGKKADPDLAPHVINNSWGCPEIEGCNTSNWEIMEQVVKNLKASGVMVVVSAGNDGNQGCGSINTPAAMFEASFSVGSVRQNDTISGFSSRGPVLVDSSYRLKPDVVAPGQGVRSVIRNGNYASYNGTSMAGPHVAGMVALLISANPNLSGEVEALENIIRSSAEPLVSPQDCGDFAGMNIPNATYGYGRIDAMRALKLALDFTQSTAADPIISGLSVFPNPANETIVFSFDSADSDTTIDRLEIIDLTGRIVGNYKYNMSRVQVQIPLSGIQPGVYYYKVHAGSTIIAGKFLKI